MKFLIVGAGGLGSILAAHLVRAGYPAMLLARGNRADQLERDGVVLRGLLEFKQQVPVVRPGQLCDADVMMLCTKAYDTQAALAGVKLRSLPLALSLQNGVMKNDALIARFGSGQVLGAAALISGELLADGSTQFTMNRDLQIGELAGGVSERVQRLVQVLTDSGIAASVSEDIRGVEWTKYASFLAMMAAGLLTRQSTGRAMSDPETSVVMAMLVREVAALAAASGVTVHAQGSIPVGAIAQATLDQGAALLREAGRALMTRAPTHRVSALQDLLRGSRLEVDAILGHAVRLGTKLGVPVPTISTCYRLCRVLDATGPNSAVTNQITEAQR